MVFTLARFPVADIIQTEGLAEDRRKLIPFNRAVAAVQADTAETVAMAEAVAVVVAKTAVAVQAQVVA